MVNLVTDSLSAIALGMEAVESDVMNQKPRPKDEGSLHMAWEFELSFKELCSLS